MTSTIDPLNPPSPNYTTPLDTTQTVPFGVIGLPPGVKETAQRVDFRTDSFIIQCESHGYRLAWTRSTRCPCVPLNSQTEQSNPNCPRCSGAGYFFFGPGTPQDVTKIGQLNDVQKAILDTTGAFVIRGIMSTVTKEKLDFEKFGGWRTGSANVTVRGENKLGYYDRLVALDTLISYDDMQLADGTANIPTRYLVDGGVNLLMDQNFQRYYPQQDFTLQRGRIVWVTPTPPVAGTRLAISYQTHPTWIVTTHPHAARNVYIAAKKVTPQTPEGDFVDMPIQAMLRLEFLVHDDEVPPPTVIAT